MLNSFYISPRIKRIGNGEVCSDYDVQKRISGASKGNMILITGEAGTGKSCFLKKCFLEEFKRRKKDTIVFWVSAELINEKKPKNQFHFFNKILKLKYAKKNRVIIFIDGVDEIFNNEKKNAIEYIEKLRELNICVILGCRRNYYGRIFQKVSFTEIYTGHYFLVLHSSAKQYKDTYLGLYPKPHNWYSNLIKTYQEKGSDRYIHYLKDDEALRFISIARSLNEQNRDIHNWFASEIFGDIKPIQQKTYHHYGMPTDYSIAIGTYVVDERDVVPIFSREGYPIFLFRPSSNMWSIVLEGKTKYIIPHGWGQELRYDYFAKQIQKEDFKNGKLSIKNGKFVLSNSQHGYYEKKFDIDYSARFNKKQVGVRDLYKTDKFDGKNIFGDTPYIKGTIEEILDPVALFSSDTEGAVKYYVSGEEN